MLSKMKKVLAVVVATCMLLTVGGVSSSVENGIMLCSEEVEASIEELK
ncbi:MAG: hypothetical protein J6J42_08650 [Lachnospiraceae bacterium]|nr:hypothetical protein [Lachnospiraceae bacterium]